MKERQFNVRIISMGGWICAQCVHQMPKTICSFRIVSPCRVCVCAYAGPHTSCTDDGSCQLDRVQTVNAPTHATQMHTVRSMRSALSGDFEVEHFHALDQKNRYTCIKYIYIYRIDSIRFDDPQGQERETDRGNGVAAIDRKRSPIRRSPLCPSALSPISFLLVRSYRILARCVLAQNSSLIVRQSHSDILLLYTQHAHRVWNGNLGIYS